MNRLAFLLLISLCAAHGSIYADPPIAPAVTPPVCGTIASASSTTPANFITSDIDLFWRAYDQSFPEKYAETFDTEYLRKGSPGLKEFTTLRIGDAAKLAGAVKKLPKYYAALRQSSQKIDSYKPQMQKSFRCLKELYADAVIPDTYFVIGRMNSGGTLNQKGLYIAVDMYGKTADTAMEELNPWLKSVIAPVDRLPYIVAHEVVHFQQDYPPDNTLLAQSIKEGVADFIGQLIAGQNINPHLHEYARGREKELWLAFEKEMDGTDASHWLYDGDKAKDRPADMGYYMGYKIAEAYYNRQPDKKQAVRDIFKIRDFKAFLKASGYAEIARAAKS